MAKAPSLANATALRDETHSAGFAISAAPATACRNGGCSV